jgi:Uma2 family endonuclease
VLEEQTAETNGGSSHSPDELLVEGGHRWDLIDGQLVERTMGMDSCEVAAKIVELLSHHARAHKLGRVFTPDLGYQIFAEQPNKVRHADVTFITRARLPEKNPPGHCRIPPDLAIEVVSPSDEALDLEVKRLDFFRAGTRQWWLVFPETRTLYVFRAVNTCALFTDDQELTDDEVLPGFRCPVRAFFED